MKLRFEPEDEHGFHEAKDRLLERFSGWLCAERGMPPDSAGELAGDAALALDWKWAYADGDLGTWRPDDLAELLLEWCPRKLSVSPSECATIPVALQAFMEFLGAQGYLAVGSAPVPRLVATLTALADEFVVAMGDRSKFGMAKSLFAAAAEEGVDPTDPEQVQGWIASFNARPEEERRRVLGGGPGPSGFGHLDMPGPFEQAMGHGRRPSLPPVALPGDDEVAASKAEAPILPTFRELARYVGEGRKLTQKGHLALADARALVDLLGTGDAMDEVIGDRTFKTRSSDELFHLRLVFAWAKKAGVLRVVHGKVVATKRGRELADGFAGSFDRVVDGLLAAGPLSAQRWSDGWFTKPEVDELLDQECLQLLVLPYVAGEPVPIEVLTELATEIVLEHFTFPHQGREGVKELLTHDVVDLMDAFALAGMVRREGVDDPDPARPDAANRRRGGGTVELTAAGVVTLRRLLAGAGWEVPAAGRLADASATELLVGTDAGDFLTFRAELAAWRGRRTPEEALAGLATAVREIDDPALRWLALAAMADVDAGVAAPHVRRLASEPSTRGLALCWLVDQGLEDRSILFDRSSPGPFVDALACRMVSGGPEALLDTLALAGSDQAQVEVVGELWRSPSGATEMVLAAVDKVHPSKAVAKAARKALFKRRSSFPH